MAETEIKTPEIDFKAMANEEHLYAELLRLRMGYEGCGCSACQQLYRETDLSVYGSRVKQYLHLVYIVVGATGADLLKVGGERRAVVDEKPVVLGQKGVTSGKSVSFTALPIICDKNREILCCLR